MSERALPKGGRPVVRCFPSADRAFAVEVARLIDELSEPSRPDAAKDLEQLIRKRYPTAKVSPQDPLASFGGEAHVWYVYRRDAPATPDDSEPDAIAASGGAEGTVAATTAIPDGQIVAHTHGSRPVYSAAATAAMIGVPISILVGWAEADVVRPGTTPSGSRLYARDDVEDLLAVKRAITSGRNFDEARQLVRAAREQRQAGPFGRRGTGRRMLVLLAERDPYAAEMAEYFLRTEGYDVDVAFSVQEAESRAGQRVPDVSVVELLISGGAGAELCARLKSQVGNAVVAISTLDLEDAALRAGADAFLTKPLDQLQLISTIKDLLGESAMLRVETGA